MRGVSAESDAPREKAPDVSEVPRARRAPRSGWSDPRLWAGIVLVALSVVVGSRLIDSAGDTIEVWAAADDLLPGTVLESDDLVARRVHLGAPVEQRYLVVSGGPPTGRLTRAVTADELIPASAFSTTPGPELTSVSVAVPSTQVPGSVRVGSSVDVWVLPETGRSEASARRVFVSTPVLEAPGIDVGLVGSGERQVVLGVAADATEKDLAEVVQAAGEGRIVLSGRG